MPITIEAANVAKRLDALGLSANTLVGLSGTSKAQLSRFFSGSVRLPAPEIEKINAALDVITQLFKDFAPFRPDLSRGDVDGELLRDYSKGLLKVVVTDDMQLLRGVEAGLSGKKS